MWLHKETKLENAKKEKSNTHAHIATKRKKKDKIIIMIIERDELINDKVQYI
jgi:hypothetical protein